MTARRRLVSLLAGVLIGSAAVAQAASIDANGVKVKLEGLGKRIQRLQDLTEVEIVQNAYGYYVDKAQWRSLADLFDDDATLEIGGKGVFTGKARVFEYMTVGLGPIGPRNNSLIDHQQFQCLPTIHEDGVTAEVRCIAFVMSSGGWGHNYYEDDFVKKDGVWKFKTLHGPFN
ncbi:MAG: nuclear transport factor 2 family protein, partial [Proteobacteria bacterium]